MRGRVRVRVGSGRHLSADSRSPLDALSVGSLERDMSFQTGAPGYLQGGGMPHQGSAVNKAHAFIGWTGVH